jgi:nitroreductase
LPPGIDADQEQADSLMHRFAKRTTVLPPETTRPIFRVHNSIVTESLQCGIPRLLRSIKSNNPRCAPRFHLIACRQKETGAQTMINRREANAALLGGITLTLMQGAAAQAQQVVKLPPPRTDGGKPLMQALKLRRTSRQYAERPLPPQVLSDLLWAAWGINRPEAGLRTAPSWRNRQQVDLYLAMADGVWIYDPKGHRLVQHMKEDLRGNTTTGQPFVKTAPVNIVFVADASKLEGDKESLLIAAVADSAIIAQNIYLFCASEGLATVVRGLVPRVELAKRLELSPTQNIYLAQSVGYPAG